jgi:hypothetical protein
MLEEKAIVRFRSEAYRNPNGPFERKFTHAFQTYCRTIQKYYSTSSFTETAINTTSERLNVIEERLNQLDEKIRLQRAAIRNQNDIPTLSQFSCPKKPVRNQSMRLNHQPILIKMESETLSVDLNAFNQLAEEKQCLALRMAVLKKNSVEGDMRKTQKPSMGKSRSMD